MTRHFYCTRCDKDYSAGLYGADLVYLDLAELTALTLQGCVVYQVLCPKCWPAGWMPLEGRGGSSLMRS
jgi:hypothetical protein